jgi:hypothetical protein
VASCREGQFSNKWYGTRVDGWFLDLEVVLEIIVVVWRSSWRYVCHETASCGVRSMDGGDPVGDDTLGRWTKPFDGLQPARMGQTW